MNLSPIVLFVYNRPLHTQQVLDALALNKEAVESILYIYCDGAKENAPQETLRSIEDVRQLVKKETRFKQVVVNESAQNKGLANSIISGVSELINKHGSIIVLEDDIVVSKGFLKYMNEALSMYANEEKVGCIHAWNGNLDASDYPESTFFLRGADCWGWATWKRGWDLFNADGASLLNLIETNNLQYEFDRRGTHRFTEMLKAQTEGKNDSWAIRWDASLFLAGKYCLHPTRTIVKNIGLDSSGTHCGTSPLDQYPVDYITLKKIEIKEEDWFFKAYTASIKGNNKSQGSVTKRIMNIFKRL